MTYAQMDALLDAGDVAGAEAALAADQAQTYPALSGEQVQLITAKIARVKMLQASIEEAPAEEPAAVEEPSVDSEPEPKAEKPARVSRRSTPRGSARKKG